MTFTPQEWIAKAEKEIAIQIEKGNSDLVDMFRAWIKYWEREIAENEAREKEKS
jgi:hypothetical protein